MLKPPTPIDETARLLSLHSLRVLDTPSEERFDRITRVTKHFFGVDICLVSLVDSDRQWFKSKQGLEVSETPRDISFCGHAILDSDMFVVEDAGVDPRFIDNPLVTAPPRIRFYAGCPIKGPHDKVVGALCLIDRDVRGFSPEDKEMLRDFAAMVEDELSASAQLTKDELTQVANRRGFNSVVSQLLPLCHRGKMDAELLVFDLDGFKAVNDSLGHGAGDEVLQHFAKLLLKSFRTADIIARIGGDEFAVFLPESENSSSAALARLNELAATESCEVLRRLVWSVGSVSFDAARHDSVESLLADADARMYVHKSRRRR